MFFHSRQLSYQIFLPSSFHQKTLLETSFLLPLQSYGENLKFKSSLSILLYYPELKASVKGKTLTNEFMVIINPFCTITTAGLALIVFRSSPCWISCS